MDYKNLLHLNLIHSINRLIRQNHINNLIFFKNLLDYKLFLNHRISILREYNPHYHIPIKDQDQNQFLNLVHKFQNCVDRKSFKYKILQNHKNHIHNKVYFHYNIILLVHQNNLDKHTKEVTFHI